MKLSRRVRILILVVIVFAFFPLAIVHRFGPYKGKVVDSGTGQPLDGAVVFMQFFTETIGPLTVYLDATEVLTNSGGEFEVPARWITTFRLLHSWVDYPSVIIFKPGYGAWPGHPDVSPRFTPGGSLPEGEYVTMRLPKLKTREERANHEIDASFTSDIPITKWKNLARLRDIERVEVGLEPLYFPK